ncbi:MAG: hypothetical protein OCC45_08215 [Desulfotalea sp.]
MTLIEGGGVIRIGFPTVASVGGGQVFSTASCELDQAINLNRRNIVMSQEKLEYICDHFGVLAQLEKAGEEVRELHSALDNIQEYCKVTGQYDLSLLPEELKLELFDGVADVNNMTGQLCPKANQEHEVVIKGIEQKKIERTISRIGIGYYPINNR